MVVVVIFMTCLKKKCEKPHHPGAEFSTTPPPTPYGCPTRLLESSNEGVLVWGGESKCQ